MASHYSFLLIYAVVTTIHYFLSFHQDVYPYPFFYNKVVIVAKDDAVQIVMIRDFEGLEGGSDVRAPTQTPEKTVNSSHVYSAKEQLEHLTPPFVPVNMTDVFFPRSTVPRDTMTVRSRWISGTKEFIEYMNTEFIPFQAQHTNDSNPVIFLKKGTTGIAGQMRGVCDILLISILHKREFKFYAPSLQPYLFDMPFVNASFPVTLRSDDDREHILRNYFKNRTVPVDTLIDFDSHKETPGLNAEGDFNRLYPGSVAISSLHAFVGPLLNVSDNGARLLKLFGPSVAGTNPRMFWYSTCMQSLFQPTAYLRGYLKPYLKLFERHQVLGIHIRSGDAAKWKDGSFFITPRVVEQQFKRIDWILGYMRSPLIFLTSDSDVYKDMVKKRYGEIVFSVSGLELQHVGKASTQSGLLRAVMELHLLGNCDYLILTPTSGFGDCGRRINKKNPRTWYFKPLPRSTQSTQSAKQG